jgi:aerobic carbon-monoxide dehydrogenase small subunit
VNIEVNGRPVRWEVEPRVTLADFLREHLGLTGTHLGCEHGVCGSCTILLDGLPVRSCLMFAVQADGSAVTTVEGLSDGHDLHPLQRAFHEEGALQCGFCTPGLLMTALAFVENHQEATEHEIRAAIAGNLCRCTGYSGIVHAIERAITDRNRP